MKTTYRFYRMIGIIFVLFNFSFSQFYAQEMSSIIDSRDGKKYKTVRIGDQVWMAENLAYLPEVYKGIQFKKGYMVYHYNDTIVEEAKKTKNYKEYGALYRYETALTGCPDGWKLPSVEDFEILIDLYGGSWKAQKKLVSGGESNFSAVFSGIRSGMFPVMPFKNAEMRAHYWCTLEKPKKNIPYGVMLNKLTNKIFIGKFHVETGMSVRCIKE